MDICNTPMVVIGSSSLVLKSILIIIMNEMNEMDKMWLYIKPHVFVSKGNDNGMMLLYNTLSGDYMKIDQPSIISLIDELHKKSNLGTILLESVEIKDAGLSDFINETKAKDICGVQPYSVTTPRPIQLMPVLNLQRDIDKLKKDRDRSLGEGILSYLTELNIFVNSKCSQKCGFCDRAYKQFSCCTMFASNGGELDEGVLQNIVSQIKCSSIGKINIFGGDILNYSLLAQLSTLLEDYRNITYCWIHYRNYQTGVLGVLKDSNVNIIVDFPVDHDVLTCCINDSTDDNQSYHFIVSSESEYSETSELIEDLGLENVEIYPLFNGSNIDFFTSNIFLTEDDILSNLISQREIFCNQTMNANSFGVMSILSDGTVYANLNSDALGNINSDSILSLIYKELEVNTSWRKIRGKAPCTNCIYRFICPPPSNYELALGRSNLCCIKE